MLRIVGAVFLITGAGGFGFSLAAHQRRIQRLLRQLVKLLNEMEWELRYRLTPLPELCRNCAGGTEGKLCELFLSMAERLSEAEDSDPESCMNGLLSGTDLPLILKKRLRYLGRTLGRFDLEGQLQGFAEVKQLCRDDLEELKTDGKERIRCYETLALCAGVGMVILFI